MEIPAENLKDKRIISSDAYEVGEITDIRYDPFEWNVRGLKIKTKRYEELASSKKASLLILPGKFVMNDVMLLDIPMGTVKDVVVPDSDNIASLSSLISAKVVTKDDKLVGTVLTAMVDTERWKVRSLAIRLDKGAIEAMGMKKGLFAKINAEIGTDVILSSADMVHLNENMDGVRAKMTILE
jgi:sporulation protein YlmC with PRC-barrel domain